MITNNEAKSRIAAEINTIKRKKIKVKLENALGLTLADNIKARVDSPPFDQSAMDGFAMNFNDFENGVVCNNEKLENSAGSFLVQKLKKNEAIRIYTGAIIPKNCSLVVPQEHIELNGNKLVFNQKNYSAFSNIRKKGSQFKKNDVILEKGTKLNAICIALLATAGYHEVDVYQKPKVAIVVCGNELIKPGQKISTGKIFESNSLMLTALLYESQIHSVSTFYVKDKLEILVKTLKKAFDNFDLVLVSGGISVGKYDLVKEALNKIKTKEIFHKVKQKPGKPVFFGINGKKHVFGLPGNPAASLTCYFEYVKPYLNAFMGQQYYFPSLKKTVLLDDFQKKPGLTYFLKGFVENDGVSVLPEQESYKINSFVHANCLIIVPEEVTEINKGETVEYYLL